LKEALCHLSTLASWTLLNACRVAWCYFHSPSMTFAHYDFVLAAPIHEHFHPQEEVYEVIEGELEVSIDGVAQIARAGLVAIVPGNVRHSVKALTDGRAIIVDHPARPDFG
jgi:quercetin dioxygenase-like cupin family protein